MKRMIILVLAIIVMQSASRAEEIIKNYIFIPGQSTLRQTGGFAGIDELFTIEGYFDVTIDFDANTAQFDYVDAIATDDSNYGPHDINEVFQMTQLVSTEVNEFSISFEDTNPPIGGIEINLVMTFQGGQVHLTGTRQWPSVPDSFQYDIDAVALDTGVNYIYVDDDGPADFDNIQAAINSSNDGDIIIVADGTYTGAGNKNLDFGGRAITVRSQNGPETTIIDCQNSGRGFYFHSSEDTNSIVCGLTIKRGKVGNGGGICCTSSSSPKVVQCIVRDNLARGANGFDFGIPGEDGYGGGIYCNSSSHIMIEDCIINNNTALGGNGWALVGPGGYVNDGSGYGGGTYGRATIYNSIISGNEAIGGSGGGIGGGGYGGGIYGDVVVSDSTISDNYAEGGDSLADDFGGAGGGSAYGGGIYCGLDYETSIRNCVIIKNRVSGGDVTDVSFEPNFYGGDGLGAGVYNDSGSKMAIENCTIADNLAEGGKNIWTENEYDGRAIGGGCYIDNADTNVVNSIVWNNTADSNESIFGESLVLYSDIDGGWEGEGNIDVDPLFASADDFHLKSEAGRWDANSQSWVTDSNTSECIDAGDPNSDWAAELWPHGARINMGAYGGTPQASMSLSYIDSIADLDHDGDVDYNDLMLFTGKWPVEQVLLAEDLDRDGKVDFKDYAIFANELFNEGLPEPLMTYEITPCEGVILATALGDTRFTVTVEGHNIHFEDTMEANCCPIAMWLEMYVGDELIIIYERESGGMCFCICDYPVEAELGPFKPGTYTFEVYEDWGGFIGSAIVVIE